MPVIEKPLPKVVLGKAIVNASNMLGLKQVEIAEALGMHRTTFSKLKNNPSLDPTSKQGELALIVIRLAKGLSALTGGNERWIKQYMQTQNTMTGGVPVKQIASIGGLMTVLRFVDGIQAKI